MVSKKENGPEFIISLTGKAVMEGEGRKTQGPIPAKAIILDFAKACPYSS